MEANANSGVRTTQNYHFFYVTPKDVSNDIGNIKEKGKEDGNLGEIDRFIEKEWGWGKRDKLIERESVCLECL